jgi:uncharacterized Zn finger protein (UPF0148 family)
MEKPCNRCGTVDIVDDGHLICYDCFVELDLQESEEE